MGDTYSSRQLQLRSELTSDIVVSLNPDGSFETGLPVGRYEVDLTDCEFLGCTIFLPVDIEIVKGETYELDINIDTGIQSVVRPPMDRQQLIDDLRFSGDDVEEGGDVRQPFFDVTGRTITVNGNSVQVFEYPSFDGARAAAAGIGADGSTIGTTSVMWIAPPHFYSSGMLIVLYVGDDDDLRDLLEGTLGSQIAGGEPVAILTPVTPDASKDAGSTARRELGARLGVAPEDLVLVHSLSLQFNDGGMGCPEPGFSYTMAIIPGYVLLYEVNGTRYPFHVSTDGRIYADCRGENNVAAPFRVADDFVWVRDAFELDGGEPSHLGPEVVLQTRAETEVYLAESNGLVVMGLDLVV